MMMNEVGGEGSPMQKYFPFYYIDPALAHQGMLLSHM